MVAGAVDAILGTGFELQECGVRTRVRGFLRVGTRNHGTWSVRFALGRWWEVDIGTVVGCYGCCAIEAGEDVGEAVWKVRPGEGAGS